MTNEELLNPLLEFLKIPSISTLLERKPDMIQAQDFLINLFESMGLSAFTIPGKKHDAVYAFKNQDLRLPTVLIYGHYDVQPEDPLDEWKTAPFEPIVKDNAIYARGVTDNKGQFMAHVMAIKSLIERDGKLPVNIKFLIEGEEEIGSVSVAEMAKTHADKLFSCHYLIVSDSEMYAKGRPSIDISLRGLLYTEIEIETSEQDLHSGQFGGVADNPANILANVIMQLKDEGGRVYIPDFYEYVIWPTKEELADYKSLGTTATQIMEEGHFYGIGGGEHEYSLNERRWSRPTLDVNGIWGGYQGEGSKTIIPSRASAKISMRLVPNQDPNFIYEKFEDHVRSLIPPYARVSIKRLADALPYKAPTTDPSFGLLKSCLKEVWGVDPVYTGVGGSIGFVPVLANALKVPCLMVGFGLPDDNLHSPNEKLNLENYYNGIKVMMKFLTDLPSLSPKF